MKSVADPEQARPRQPIDRAHLARYTLGDRELEAEILGLFLGQLEKSLEQMRVARDDEEWKMATHALKGTGRAVGAWQVAEISQSAEQLVDLSDRDARARAVADVERAAAAARQFIESGLPESD